MAWLHMQCRHVAGRALTCLSVHLNALTGTPCGSLPLFVNCICRASGGPCAGLGPIVATNGTAHSIKRIGLFPVQPANKRLSSRPADFLSRNEEQVRIVLADDCKFCRA